jgi:hypothetical protein
MKNIFIEISNKNFDKLRKISNSKNKIKNIYPKLFYIYIK